MPTVFSHPAVPLMLGLGLGRRAVPWSVVAAGAALSALPDLDVLAFRLGVPYADPFGHRGFFHSLLFALAAGAFTATLMVRLRRRPLPSPWPVLALLLLSSASHPLLDSLTTGGLGIALLAPFSDRRFFLPWQVIKVAPFNLSSLAGEWGKAVLRTEAAWVWLPAASLGGILRLVSLGLSLWRPTPGEGGGTAGTPHGVSAAPGGLWLGKKGRGP